jgi:hypothetical protein
MWTTVMLWSGDAEIVIRKEEMDNDMEMVFDECVMTHIHP